MPATVLNCFEESHIKNRKLPLEWQDQNSLDELAEFLQLNWEQRSVFYEDGEVTSRQQFLGFTSSKGIRTNNYIGTIVFKGQQLNIFPKVFREDKDDNDTDELNLDHLMKNLVQWLQYCKKIDYPFISVSSELDNSKDLRELFITLYLHYVKQALDYGPFYRYEERLDTLGVIKGHLDFKDYINHKIPNGQNNRFLCSFSEFEFDNAVNRIIKYTCKGLINETGSAVNKKIIRNILIRFNEVKDVRCVPSDCDGIRLSKLNRQYSVILSMSKMFLLNQTTTYQIDNQETFCFLFPTELLFEGFIGGFISEMLEDKGTVRLQASDMSIFTDLFVDGESQGAFLTMRHDILVDHFDKGLFILDTKYKEISRLSGGDSSTVSTIISHETSSGDVQQMITYAYRRGVKDVYLLYPMYRLEKEDARNVYGISPAGKGDGVIKVHFIRLPFVFEENTEGTKAVLTRTIQRILTNC